MGAFSRARKLPFVYLIVLLLRTFTSSLQRELDSFYKEVTDRDFNIRQVTKGAFTQARAKLNHEAFIELNSVVVNTFYNEAPYLRWKGFRLLAIDGTRMLLPKHPSVIEEFGTHSFGPKADSKQSLAIGSFLYDPLNLITVDAQIAPYSCSETELLYKHLDIVKSGDLLLMDRGYPSIALMFLLIAKGIHFCIRMKLDWWLEVKKFVHSGEKEKIVTFHLPKKDNDLLIGYPDIKGKSIQCRLILVELENGEKEVLCTSLIDTIVYPHEIFKELYGFRWGVEEAYKLYKTRIEVENFSGKTALAVKQDFYAKVFMMSLCAALAFPIEKKVKKETMIEKESKKTKRKHECKINRTNALSMLRNIAIGLFLKNQLKKGIKAFDDIVSKTVEIIRPNRKFPRNKILKKPYSMNYKRL